MWKSGDFVRWNDSDIRNANPKRKIQLWEGDEWVGRCELTEELRRPLWVRGVRLGEGGGG